MYKMPFSLSLTCFTCFIVGPYSVFILLNHSHIALETCSIWQGWICTWWLKCLFYFFFFRQLINTNSGFWMHYCNSTVLYKPKLFCNMLNLLRFKFVLVMFCKPFKASQRMLNFCAQELLQTKSPELKRLFCTYLGVRHRDTRPINSVFSTLD